MFSRRSKDDDLAERPPINLFYLLDFQDLIPVPDRPLKRRLPEPATSVALSNLLVYELCSVRPTRAAIVAVNSSASIGLDK
jgi:hypothetical protein